MNTNNEPKDALEFRFKRAIDRALLSPIISGKQTIDHAKFVDWYDLPIYKLGVGLLVIFLDASKYDLALGSFYPFWVLQAGYVSRKNTNIKLSLLTPKQRDRAVELNNRILDLFEGAKQASNVRMRQTDTDYEWRVPLSEAEIAQMSEVFQNLVRRAK